MHATIGLLQPTKLHDVTNNRSLKSRQRNFCSQSIRSNIFHPRTNTTKVITALDFCNMDIRQKWLQ